MSVIRWAAIEPPHFVDATFTPDAVVAVADVPAVGITVDETVSPDAVVVLADVAAVTVTTDSGAVTPAAPTGGGGLELFTTRREPVGKVQRKTGPGYASVTFTPDAIEVSAQILSPGLTEGKNLTPSTIRIYAQIPAVDATGIARRRAQERELAALGVL